MKALTPFQTIGPFFDVLLRSRAPSRQVTDGTTGERVTIEGALYDGAGEPVPDGLIETWQADSNGRFAHPEDKRDDPAADPKFAAHGWSGTDASGEFVIETIKPGPVPSPDRRGQAPHILIGVLARGILTRYVTRLYFDDEPATDSDPILALVPSRRRPTLIARSIGSGRYRFDIRLQGPAETVFFDV